MKRLTFLFSLLLSLNASALTWFDGTRAVTFQFRGGHDIVVTTALDMFSQDMEDVTGQRPVETKESLATIIIVELDRASGAVRKALNAIGIATDSLAGCSDAFSLHTAGGKIYAVGGGGRGTAYALLELSRLAGVSPWRWWNDNMPQKKASLTIADNFSLTRRPSVTRRGIFINDEDWSLQPWSWQTYEPDDKQGTIGARTYKKIFQLLLRLRANMIWPGMHGSTVPFYLVPGAKAAADSCGIIIGTSHCEPLMRNNVGEWNVSERGRYNYVTNSQAVRDYWTERLKEVKGSDCVYTIGMRGIHDGSMEGVKTMREKVEWLQRAIDDQRSLLSRYINKDVTKIPQVFVPYKEVLDIMENGLDVPDDVTLLWCDDNYGYLTRLSDSLQQRRTGGAGVYYHLSYWGRPHDYLWLATTQPGLIWSEMRNAYDQGARKQWIVNVHDPKIAAYPMELFLDMAWDVNSVGPNTLSQHLERWLSREFGDDAGRRLLPVMREFYRLTAIRKPEFMGWNQTELDKTRYPRGWSPVSDTEFNPSAFGDELDRYLDDYAAIAESVKEVKRQVPARALSAYFAAVEYPVLAAEAMAVKMLEAQKARALAAGQHDSTLWKREEALLTACSRSMNAYRRIQQLTDYYNNELSGGKWRYEMNSSPRDLYVFWTPWLPLTPDEERMARQRENDSNNRGNSDYHYLDTDSAVALNACQYAEASGDAYTVDMLGHSMKAVALPKGSHLIYNMTTQTNGDALLKIALIPTQPNDKGDVRISVSIDGGTPVVASIREKGRTTRWKENVLRGQAVVTIPVNITAGRHTVVIKALDNHIEVDQLMIDQNINRKYYLFPVATPQKK